MANIAVLTGGLWRLRREIATLTGMTPVRWDTWPRPSFAAVAGWGHKPTAERAKRLAARSGKPYIAFEDGPLRSVRPGPAEPPSSMVVDRSGIYYDANTASDLLDFATDPTWSAAEQMSRARAAAALLKRLTLSKYNCGPARTPGQLGLGAGLTHRILVLDQVHGDASIPGGLADSASFDTMLAAAIGENPAAEIVVKLHPDTVSGRRAGYFTRLAPADRIRLVAEPVNPWSLIEAVDAVYTVSSGLGFEAALAGKAVVCFGSPFYSGWGFTDDRSPKAIRPRKADPLELFAAYYLRYARYLDAYSRHEIAFEEAAEQLAWLRDRFLAQDRRVVCFRIPRWKRAPLNRMLEGPAGVPLHSANIRATVEMAQRTGGRIVAWASRDIAPLEKAATVAGVPLARVEDGFVRSAGLGASFALPRSLVMDGEGIYYDSRSASALETMLQTMAFPLAVLDRARCLREQLVAARTTKYNIREQEQVDFDSAGRPIVLVPGQVEDDASIHRGSPRLKRNIDLLRAVRERHPDGFIVYKPHPDVEAGFRRGRVPKEKAAELADRIVTRASILRLIELADRVETMTSLAGFEALLRGKPVTTHGQPFYAGWGLTEDLCPVERRTRKRSLDELVAATLILYPHYIDPASGRPCSPELLIERLAAEARRPPNRKERAARLARNSAARALHLGSLVKLMARRSA